MKRDWNSSFQHQMFRTLPSSAAASAAGSAAVLLASVEVESAAGAADELAQLLLDMLDYRNYELQEMRVPADNTFTNQVISGMDVLSVDFNANAQLFKELVYGTVEVSENGEEQKQAIE